MRLSCCAGSCVPAGPELGLYLQLLSGACASAMGLAAKVVGGMGVPVFEIVLARSLVVLVVSGAMVASNGGSPAKWPWRSERRWLLLLRGLAGFAAISCYYSAVQLLPLADVAVLTFLSPVFVALLAPCVLGEGAGGWPVAASLPLCFAGLLLVAQPTFLFGSAASALNPAGVVIAVAQAVCMAAAKFCVRSLGRSESVGSIMLSMALTSVVGSAALAAVLPGQALVRPPSGGAAALLLATGVLACGVQSLATKALKLARATPVTLMGYLGVVWGILGDLIVYGRRPSPLGLLGAALVCSSSVIIILAEKRSGGGGGGGDGSRAEDVGEERGPLLAVKEPGLKAKGSSSLKEELNGGDAGWAGHGEAGAGGLQQWQQRAAGSGQGWLAADGTTLHPNEQDVELAAPRRRSADAPTAAGGSNTMDGGGWVLRHGKDGTGRAPLVASPRSGSK